tara:strand:- start:3375 stop:3800 length:426 start_codon:yes stop_codon:yes gene_type:complete
MTFNSSGILITVKGSVLLSKRIEKYKNKPVPFGGYWSPFSGMIEEGEDPKDCAIRELKEESGLDIEKSKVEKIGVFNNKESKFYLFACELDYIPSIKLCEEHTEYGFFDINKLHIFPDPVDKRLMDCLRIYKKIRKKEKNF